MAAGVYLAVPAYPLRDAAERERALTRGAAFAARLGLPLTTSPLIDEVRPHGAWLPAERRREDLARGLAHRVLLAVRGGYGCVDLVETLQRCDRRSGPLLVGYSDLTVLHAWWRRQAWGESIYGFMPATDPGPRALDSAVVCAGGAAFTLDGCGDQGTPVRTGEAEGPLFAACLRVLAGLVGTPAMPDLRGAILALEDLDERPYAMDRDLMQLHLAGALREVRGLLLGRFRCELPAGYAGPSLLEVAAAWAGRLAVPTACGLGFGHDPDPLALPCGRRTRFTCDAAGWRLAFSARVPS